MRPRPDASRHRRGNPSARFGVARRAAGAEPAPAIRSDPDTMSEQRDVTTPDGTAWTCIEALADMPEAAKDKLAGPGRRAVVCTPSGGAHSVRLSLAEAWQAMPEADLAAAIQAGLGRGDV